MGVEAIVSKNFTFECLHFLIKITAVFYGKRVIAFFSTINNIVFNPMIRQQLTHRYAYLPRASAFTKRIDLDYFHTLSLFFDTQRVEFKKMTNNRMVNVSVNKALSEK